MIRSKPVVPHEITDDLLKQCNLKLTSPVTFGGAELKGPRYNMSSAVLALDEKNRLPESLLVNYGGTKYPINCYKIEILPIESFLLKKISDITERFCKVKI